MPVRSPAERPVRSAAKAFDTRSAEPCDPTGDFLSRERPCSTISVGLVAGQRYQRPARPQQRFCWLPPVAPTEDLSPERWAGFRPPGGAEPLYPIRRAGTHPRPQPTATHHHLLTDGLADGSDQQWGQLARPEITRSVRSVPLFDVASCLQDDAPVRRVSRLRTTSDSVRWAH